MEVIRDGKITTSVDTTIKGIELADISEAITLARNLGVLASDYLAINGTDLDCCMAIEALRLQDVLLNDIEGRSDTDVPFSFRAIDAELTDLPNFARNNPFYFKRGMAGRILDQAINFAERTSSIAVSS